MVGAESGKTAENDDVVGSQHLAQATIRIAQQRSSHHRPLRTPTLPTCIIPPCCCIPRCCCMAPLTADFVEDGAYEGLGGACDADEHRPPWLPDAHRVLGEAMQLAGDRAGAIEHFRRYLEIAPASALDRASVGRSLAELGITPTE